MLQKIIYYSNLFCIIQQVFYIIILIIQNYFSDLYPSKILDFSAKSFFLYVS